MPAMAMAFVVGTVPTPPAIIVLATQDGPVSDAMSAIITSAPAGPITTRTVGTHASVTTASTIVSVG